MKRFIVAIMLLIPVMGFAQDRCPSFKITKQRSGMHYDFKMPNLNPKPKALPREGLTIFGGVYSYANGEGFGFSGRVQMVEYGFSGGWDARVTNPYTFKKVPEGEKDFIYTNTFGATVGKYFIIGNHKNIRGLADVGLGYGHSARSMVQNPIPVFGYAMASYRVVSDVWISGSLHVTDFKSTPILSFGLATLIW